MFNKIYLSRSEESQKWWTLVAVIGALALSFIDLTGLAAALPAMQAAFNLTDTGTQWILNAYSIAMSGLILFAGKAGDMLGHRKLFLAGVGVFTASSLLCSLSPNGAWIIWGRVIQGIGGAFMVPLALTLVNNAFPVHQRGQALGVCLGISGVFLASGPSLAGMLVQWKGWESVFWINLPIGVIVCALVAFFTRAVKSTKAWRMDWKGVIFSMGFSVSLCVMLMKVPDWNWISKETISLFLLACLLFVFFLIFERRSPHPLVKLSLFKIPMFSLCFFILLLLQVVMMPGYVFLQLFFQKVFNLSPAKSGLLLLTLTAPMIVVSPIAGYLQDRYGPRLPMVCGSVLVCVGFLGMALLFPQENYSQLVPFLKRILPFLLLYGVGFPLCVTGIPNIAMNYVAVSQRGIVSALMSWSRQLGSSLGLALFTALVISINKQQIQDLLSGHGYGHLMALGNRDMLEGILVKSKAALQLAHGLPQHVWEWLYSGVVHAYSHAITMLMYLAFFITLIILVGAFYMPNEPMKASGEGEGDLPF